MDDNALPPDGSPQGYEITPVDHDPFAMDPQAEPAALALPPDQPAPAPAPEATPSPLKAALKSWDDYGAVGGVMKAAEIAKHAPELLNTEVSLPTREQWQAGEQAVGHGIEHLATLPMRVAEKFQHLTTPVEPETPGMVSDYDISREQAREKEEGEFGASTALQMVLGGPGAAEEGAAGVAGGRLKQPTIKPKDVFPPDRPVQEKPNTQALWQWQENPNHPDMADARYPTGNKQEDDTGPYLVDTAALKRTPKSYENNVNLARDYPGVNIPKNASTDQAAESFIERSKDNLLWLWDQVPEANRARSRQWYDGGNKIVKDWAQKYNVPESSVAAVIATQSPQMPWDMNVSLGQRILDIHRGNGPDFYQNFRGTDRMDAFFNATPALQKYKPIWDDIKDKSLGEIDEGVPFEKDERAAQKALWTRVYDDAHSDRSYNLVTPEGYFGPQADGPMHWGTLGMIENGIKALEANGDRNTINTTLGNKHKVREFYNNLLAPNSPRGDVTIDTHAVAAAHLRPLGGSSNEVAHSLEMSAKPGQPNSAGSDITGIRGTYPLYADAYRRAAAERGVLPREMQSVTWEALKGLFPSKKSGTIYDNIWRQHAAGARGIDETRQLVLKQAGGIEPPWWTEYKRTGEPNAPVWNAGDAEVVSGPGLHGEGAPSADGGAGSGDAARTAAESAQASANTTPGWGGVVGTGSLRKASGETKDALVAQSRATAAEVANGRPKLIGLPDEHITKAGYFTPGPVGYLHDIAERYMHDEGLPYNPPKTYAELDTGRAGRIANSFETMKHAPNDPAVRESYDAMIQETLAQYRALKRAGIKFEMIKPGMEDPYKATPRLAAKDVIDNKHLWVYPTDTGFGSDAAAQAAIKDNPLLAPTDEYIDGKRLAANDVFRIVHDMFGHIKDGNGFRARGEENAWRSHSAMYSDAARPAMTSETRGQNSWLNYGPYGETNRTASAADTRYADQKVGLLPRWVVDEGRGDVQSQPTGRTVTLGSGSNDKRTAPLSPIIAYHGSPHNFDKFDVSKIGTGEGNQSYGHGLYFAENPVVSESYANAKWKYGNTNAQTIYDKLYDQRQERGLDNEGWSKLNAQRGFWEKVILGRSPRSIIEDAKANPEIYGENELKYINSLDTKKFKSVGGNLYQAAIKSDPSQFLDWDKTLSEQHPDVRDKYMKALPTENRHLGWSDVGPGSTGEQLYKQMAARHGDVDSPTSLRANPEKASQALREAGIPGIKYLDQGSRLSDETSRIVEVHKSRERALAVAEKNLAIANKTFGIGLGQERAYWGKIADELKKPQTSNYVVFDDSLAHVLKKNGIDQVVKNSASHFQTQQVDHDPFKGNIAPKRADGGAVDDDDDQQQLGILGTSLQGPMALTAAMGEHADWDKFERDARPSTNIEDDRNRPKTFKEKYNNIIDDATEDITSPLFRAHGGRVEPKNINHNPTPAQAKANNYAKDHVNLHGMQITIENAAGSTRRGVGRDGKPWSAKIPKNAHYGYIRRV